MIDLILLEQFYIITHLKIYFSLIICHKTYLTLSINIHQPVKSAYTISLILNLRQYWFLIRYFFRHIYVKGCTHIN